MLEGVSRPRWMADCRRCRSFFVSPGPVSVGQCPAVGGVREAEVEEPTQVDDGCSEVEAEPVAFDTALADAAMVVGDEPGDGAFDHRPPLLVVIDPNTGAPLAAGGREQLVVFCHGKGLARCAGGAP